MAIGSYQLPSPRAIDPPPGEYQLAHDAGASNPLAMLLMYRADRDLMGQQYNQELASQHDFAKQQLLAQMAGQHAEALGKFAEHPELLPLAAASPEQSAAFGGAGPEAIRNVIAAAQGQQAIKNLPLVGAAANSFDQAGVSVPADTYGGLTGLPMAQGTSRAERVQTLANAGRLAAAQAGAGGAGPSISVKGTPNADYGGAETNVTFSGKTHQTPEGALEYARTHGMLPNGITNPLPKGLVPPAPNALPPAQQDSLGSGEDILGSIPAAAAQAAPLGGTNVQQSAPQAAKPLQSSANPTTSKVEQAAKTYIQTNKANMPPAMYNDLVAGMQMNGGNPIIKVGPDGKPGIYGAKGGPYNK